MPTPRLPLLSAGMDRPLFDVFTGLLTGATVLALDLGNVDGAGDVLAELTERHPERIRLWRVAEAPQTVEVYVGPKAHRVLDRVEHHARAVLHAAGHLQQDVDALGGDAAAVRIDIKLYFLFHFLFLFFWFYFLLTYKLFSGNLRRGKF